MIKGGRQRGVVGSRTVLDAVDKRLRVLDARADGKGLGTQLDLVRQHQLIDRAGTVTDRQHDILAQEVFVIGMGGSICASRAGTGWQHGAAHAPQLAAGTFQ